MKNTLKKKVLIVGLPFYAKKYEYLSEAYFKKNIDIIYLIDSNKPIESKAVNYVRFTGNSRINRFFSILCICNIN